MGPRGGQENGWGRRIRTPATWSRATCPPTRRSPSAEVITAQGVRRVNRRPLTYPLPRGEGELLDGGFEGLAGLEAGDARWRDPHRVPGPRVGRHPRLTARDLEGAEARDRHPVPLSERVADGGEEGVDRALGEGLGAPRGLRYRYHQLRLRHDEPSLAIAPSWRDNLPYNRSGARVSIGWCCYNGAASPTCIAKELRMLRGGPVDISTVILVVLAVVFTVLAYLKDPSLPWIGARNGLSLLWFILPRLVPALILTGMLQVLIPQEYVSRYFGREAGFRGIVIASIAGVLPPGGPVVSVPLMVALAHSGAGLAPPP